MRISRPLDMLRPRRVAVVAALTAIGLLTGTVASSAPAPVRPDAVVDSETVYVVADATGQPRTTVVVDWLQVTGSGTIALADPAPGVTKIESLTDGFAPTRQGEDVVATVEVDGTGDFFYRAETSAELPLEVRMRYYLDGREVSPSELAGKSGRLTMELTLTNRLERTDTITFEGIGGMEESAEVTYTVPLLCIPKFEIDGTRMTDIAAPSNAQLAITGSTRTYAVPMVPSPTATATLEMDARDIELAPLVISVFPKLPSSADFSVVDQLAELRDGLAQLGQLSSGHLAIVEGMNEGLASRDLSGVAGAAAGLAALENGLSRSAAGARDLQALASGQQAYLDALVRSIDTSRFDSIGELIAAVSDMREACAELETGAAGLVTLLDGQVALLAQIDALAGAALGNATVVAARYPADTEAQALAAQLGQLKAMTSALLDGGDLGSGYMPGLRYLRAQLDSVARGLSGLRAGLEELEAGAAGLRDVPAAFAQIKGALIVLRDGGDPDGAGPAPLLPGLVTTTGGLASLADGLQTASGGLAAASDDLGMLGELPGLLGDFTAALGALAHGGALQGREVPGIDTTVAALDTIVGGLDSGVRDAHKGKALVDTMSEAADTYTSFLGAPDGAEGHLTFLFKLDGVSKE
jgi:putative membrane protein